MLTLLRNVAALLPRHTVAYEKALVEGAGVLAQLKAELDDALHMAYQGPVFEGTRCVGEAYGTPPDPSDAPPTPTSRSPAAHARYARPRMLKACASV